MPINDGVVPPFTLVDIKYRSGVVVRGVDPNTRRWTLNDPAFGENYDFDIRSWQPVTRR